MHKFTPADGLYVCLDFKEDSAPFRTTTTHIYRDEITEVIVPIGFRTDFASVPRFLWWLYPRVGRYSPAALIHDSLYRYELASRAQADAIFLRIMTDCQVPDWQRYPMWAAVRLFGGFAWRKLRRGQ